MPTGQLQVGQKVVHTSRLDLGLGEVQAVVNGAVNVAFTAARFTGIPASALAPAGSVSDVTPVPPVMPALTPEAHLQAVTARYRIPALWHITSRENVATILDKGLLSRHQIQRAQLPLVDISDASVQECRMAKGTRNGLTLHDHVPLYLRAKNPMLYCRRHRNATLCLLEVVTYACLADGVLFTDGNAASSGTCFFENLSDLRFLSWDALDADYWSNVPDGKRKRCAEVLVPHHVPARLVRRVHAATAETRDWLLKQGINAVHSPTLFF